MKYLILNFTLFLFSFYTALSQNKIIDQSIAVVGDNCILRSEIENQFLQLESNSNFQGNDLKCNILEDLLFQNLLLHQAAIDSITVGDKEIDAQLERRIRYFVSQIGSEKKLEEYFNKSITEIKRDLRNALQKQMLAEKMQEKITGNIKVTPSEVRQYFKDIPKDSIPVINEQVEYEQIVLFPVISEKEKLAVKEKLNGYRERVLKGDKFSTLAVLYSQDPGSAVKGGELGFVGRNDLVPEFASVAFRLKEGEVSKIVETEYGYHIIQLIERLGEQINVRHLLQIPKADPVSAVKARLKLDSISKQIKNDSISFKTAVEKYSQDKETRSNGGLAINPMTNNSKFEISQLEAPTSSIIKNLKPGELSDPFEFTNDKSQKCFKIIRLKSRFPTHKANLSDDYQIIQDSALNKRKLEEMQKWIENKQKFTYIKIDNSYKNCEFKYKGWIK
jgi:peptidyl-prolyl cis-trans isomerase SurA